MDIEVLIVISVTYFQVYSDEESETLLLQNQNPLGQFTLLNDNIPVKVLDCDSIGEVKEKCLDHIYK